MLGTRSRKRLEGLHPDLVRVVERADALGLIDFAVTEGLRSRQRQAELVADGHSTTMNSRHLTGHAVDLVPLFKGKPCWKWPSFYKLAPLVKMAAQELGVAIEWGGDWATFKDGPHFQLPWEKYPPNHPPSG